MSFSEPPDHPGPASNVLGSSRNLKFFQGAVKNTIYWSSHRFKFGLRRIPGNFVQPDVRDLSPPPPPPEVPPESSSSGIIMISRSCLLKQPRWISGPVPENVLERFICTTRDLPGVALAITFNDTFPFHKKRNRISGRMRPFANFTT